MTQLTDLTLLSGFVHLQKQEVEGVWLLSLQRPETKNALNVAMYTELHQVLSVFSDDESARVLVLAGSHGDFCSGNDLGDFAALGGKVLDEASPIWQFMVALRDCPKPVVIAVEGVAVGIGTTMLLHVDAVFASSSSIFSLPFTKLGLCPEYGSSLLLPLRVGALKASEWLMLGRKIPAEEAAEAGLVSALCGEPLHAALEHAAALSSMPKQALITTKQLLRQPYTESLHQAMEEEAKQFRQALKGTEFAEAVAAFFNRK